MEKLNKESQNSIIELLDDCVVKKITDLQEQDKKKLIDEIQSINKEIQDSIIKESRTLREIGEENNSKSDEIINSLEQFKTLKNEIESIKNTQHKLSKISFFLIIFSSLSIVGMIVSIILLLI